MAKILKGQKLHVLHRQMWSGAVVATEDFNTERQRCWPVVVAEKRIYASWGSWAPGERIPCRGAQVLGYRVFEDA